MGQRVDSFIVCASHDNFVLSRFFFSACSMSICFIGVLFLIVHFSEGGVYAEEEAS